ncbi:MULTISPECIES: proline dehydrogenase family protein [Bacillaceae]|uniref:proline dehydrogenase family protein n=1 Tax=Bacillaceae TaxID=186817 RepID=UPI001C564C1F|nr:proline dehydrogenase family protein [Rossellomorea sp. YZS02]MBW3111556.1 proline dehydrogenase family protein [Bacillus sp. MCCB 382]MDX8344922.1 proline dehydrogenase family protein [Rossellomorea sp. YZS02]
MEAISKRFFLFLSHNKALDKMAKRWGSKFGANNLVGGETFAQAIPLITQLNEEGFQVTVDHLGEFVDSTEVVRENVQRCIESISAIAYHGLETEISVKLTSLGLDISQDLVMESMELILSKAKESGITVTLDMEDSSRCHAILDVYKKLCQKYDNVGTVIQSYLYVSEKDVDDLNQCSPYLRLVKGAYNESGKVAFQEKKKVDENLKHLIKKQLLNGHYTAIASHDEAIINYTIGLVKEHNIPNDRFEFQMLYGMRNQLQSELLKKGYTVRIYLPYGEDWFGYFMRRLAERPANIAFALKGIFSK